ncbi:hypothetical protein QTP88_007557 [Uroleucon formosanum]
MILAKEFHKPVRKRFPKRRIYTKDTFSKFSWAFELNNKDGISVSKAFEKIIERAKSQKHQAPKLLHVDKENKLNDHKYYCANNKAAKIVLPESYNKTLEFEKYNNSLRAPFVIYADFEATLQPIYTCKPSDKEAFTNCYQKHIPNNFCYYIKYSNDDYKPPVEYSGSNVTQEFFECMKNEEKAISKIYGKIVPMEKLNAEQLNKHYNKSDKCHICERYLLELPPMLEKKFKIIKGVIEYYKQFKIVENDDVKKLKLYKNKLKNELKNKNKNMRKVRNHDHLTGIYRGAAHSICNLNYQNPRFIPIVFHNLSG